MPRSKQTDAGKRRPTYALHDGRPQTPPDYGRVARVLRDDELEEEIRSGRGEPGYQEALAAERDRRSIL